jgi:hypothetical protein
MHSTEANALQHNRQSLSILDASALPRLP